MDLATMIDSSPPLAAIARTVHFDTGQGIVEVGDPSPGLFLIRSGRILASHANAEGKEHVLQIVGPGEIFAEISASGGFCCLASARALEPTCCTFLPRDLFCEILQKDPDLSRALLSAVAERARALVANLQDLVLRDATSRVACYLLDAKDAAGLVTLPTLKRYIASHLNLTAESLSRALKALEDQGLIAKRPDSIAILDQEGLSMQAGR